jgi:hypothetical protein
VVGRTHEIKGQAVAAFVTVKEGVQATESLMLELKDHVAKKIGSIAKPDDVIFTADLPKTRSGKIMRRLLRDIAEGKALGDTTTLADPNVVARLKEQYQEEHEGLHRGPVLRADFSQRRLSLEGSWIQLDPLTHGVGIERRNSAEQRPCVWVRWTGKQCARLTELHDLPHVHDRDAGANVFDQAQVVCDEQIRQLEALFQIEQQFDDLCLDGYVESRDRFVGDDQRWIERERARDADALTLPPAELVRVTQDMRRLQADQLEQLGDASPPLRGAAEAVDDQRLLDDLTYTHARIERRVRILKDHLHVAPSHAHPLGRKLQNVLPAKEHFTGCRFNQAQDAAPGRALSAS